MSIETDKLADAVKAVLNCRWTATIGGTSLAPVGGSVYRLGVPSVITLEVTQEQAEAFALAMVTP